MPYITDAGARPWSEVINETGDRVRSAFAGVARHNEGVRQQDAQIAEQNRVLHPATQKWLSKVMNEGMDPGEAARGAHEEIDANNNGIPDFQEAAAPAAPPVNVGNPTKLTREEGEPTPEPGMMAAAKTSAPKAPVYGPGPQQPFTMRDMGPIKAALDYKVGMRPRGLTDDDFVERENLKKKNKIEVNTAANTEKGSNALALQGAKDKNAGIRLVATLNSRSELLAQKLEAMRAMLREKLAAARSDKILAAQLSHADRIVVAKINALARIRSSLSQIAGDEDAVNTANRLEAELQSIESEASGSVAGGPEAPAPAASAAPTAPQEDAAAAPPIPTTIPVQDPGTPDIPGVEASTPAPAARPLPAAIPAPKMKTGTQKGFRMRFPDGSIHTVPKEKLEAAKKKGGVPA